MNGPLVHIFSVKEQGAQHWKLVGSPCHADEEYPSHDHKRVLEEEVMIHFPGSDVHYLVTAESATVTQMKKRA